MLSKLSMISDLNRLAAYLGPNYFIDFQALSDDGLFDLLTSYHLLAIRMRLLAKRDNVGDTQRKRSVAFKAGI